MKKNYLFGSIAMSLLVLGACSSADEPEVGFSNDPYAQQILIQVSNAEDALGTRAGRPLNSSEAKQNIDAVKVIITDLDGNVVYVNNISNWMEGNTSTAYSTNGHGRQKVVTIDEGHRLEAGKSYNVYAFGYNTSTDYDTSAITDVAEKGTFNENAKITLNVGENGKLNAVGEEIFAGSKTHKVNENKDAGFQISVVLNRQVAGAYGYFSSVPYMEGAAKLRLVADNNLNQDLILGSFINTLIYNNGNNTGVKTYVMNAANPKADTNVIYEINLADWYGTIKDDAKDGLIDIDGWKQPTGFGTTKIFKTGTCFGGNFILPFAHGTSGQTLTLQLTDASNKVLRYWPVLLGENDPLTQEHNLISWTGTAFETGESHTGTANVYNVVRNHLYGIGNRKWDTGVPPTQPDKDPDKTPDPDDKPESLNKKEQLTLRVNDNWEVIHNMGIGDAVTPGK